jgi:two-component system, cell cycle response regulator
LLDHLTGIGNRRFIERRLEIALLEFQQHHTPSGILFMDIDRFKAINDTYGHENGDKVLRMVAITLRHNLRVEDAIARWGGEEFVALLAGMDYNGLGKMAKKLNTLIAASSLRIDDSNVSVTISVGGTIILPEDDSIQSIINRADQNMYKNKPARPNRETGISTRTRKKKV